MKRVWAMALGLWAVAPALAAAAEHGWVSSVLSRQSERLYAVRVVSVDGRNLPENGRQSLPLAPGRHKLGIVALIERDHSFGLRERRRPSSKFVEIDVVEGQQYRIGAKVLDARYEEWSAVIE